ncbi:DNA-methyltransferase [Tropheryma whipplei]|uniref:DNA-methyltransferase n=1 Tax=Tropheryma whipplei TaxID=2039 RepID=UPI0005AB2A0E|nr:site-specific DNA-methyltransferase [Tropheryma whipplei]
MRNGCTCWSPDGDNLVVQGNNIDFLHKLPDDSFQLIYIDPPFNTGKRQTRQCSKMVRSPYGKQIGFCGNRYKILSESRTEYADMFDDYLGFLKPRLHEAWRLLKPEGMFYLHLDYREVHYAKILLDSIFGRDSFINEIIWAYDYGAKTKRRWPAKHDNILVYAKDPRKYLFDSENVDREPYMAPGLVTPDKAKRGKLPTDVWWHTIVSPTGKEKTGYPTQKPEGVLRRIIQASSRPNDWVLDFFAGSGTTGIVAGKLGRKFVLIDNSPQAVKIMKLRIDRSLSENPVRYTKLY